MAVVTLSELWRSLNTDLAIFLVTLLSALVLRSLSRQHGREKPGHLGRGRGCPAKRAAGAVEFRP
eukprot:CAMPEP_0168434768 /NCGR_PEP_ID=MMETSP0228-20121227/40073_1 /TAXON_ID=133427 /ORGANISM="Protoceratium reticulatum, Strain CCCM 535 (=CCMP 1889)" /LENGTH=64 /DNA_ID=CAMNT_0008448929 /DNA_START=127 /DNA_END=318 /DNA_ORIENTATION=+